MPDSIVNATGTVEVNNAAATPDLALPGQSTLTKNYFDVKIAGLKIDKNYAIQFQWVYPDGTTSDWSPGYSLGTPAESVPTSPTASVPNTNASYIPVTLPTFPTNAKRVDIYITGGVYGSGKVADSFLQAGTKSISAAAGTYQVSLITVSPSNINGTPSNVFTITVTDPTANIQSPEASKTPSAPTVTSVLGAIQVSWDGKQADGSNQPYGFNAAKVYVGTTAGFTPSSSNQVDVLNFANGQNTLDIGVGTVVNGVAMTYNTDYYIKIATTNGTDISTPVSANGNPKQIGKVGSGDIVSVLADQITTGTLSASSTITIGAAGGKRVELRGTGNPIEIFGTGGDSVLSYNTGASKLTIKGDGNFTGSLTGASGTFGPVTIGTSGISSTNFSIANDGSASFNGIITASGGSIGGWYLNSSILRSTSSASTTPRIELDPLTPQIILAGTTGSITMSPESGIVGPNVTVANSTGPGFSLSPNGNAVLRGTIYADSGVFSGNIRAASIDSNTTITGSTITGAQIQSASDYYFGYIRLNSPTLEVVGSDGTVYGQLYQFNNGNELMLRHGSSRTLNGYPTSSSYLTLNPYTVTLGYTDSLGSLRTGLMVSTNGDHSVYGTFQSFGQNNQINLARHRNIYAGTATPGTTTFNNTFPAGAYQVIGDIYIQY